MMIQIMEETRNLHAGLVDTVAIPLEEIHFRHLVVDEALRTASLFNLIQVGRIHREVLIQFRQHGSDFRFGHLVLHIPGNIQFLTESQIPVVLGLRPLFQILIHNLFAGLTATTKGNGTHLEETVTIDLANHFVKDFLILMVLVDGVVVLLFFILLLPRLLVEEHQLVEVELHLHGVPVGKVHIATIFPQNLHVGFGDFIIQSQETLFVAAFQTRLDVLIGDKAQILHPHLFLCVLANVRIVRNHEVIAVFNSLQVRRNIDERPLVLSCDNNILFHF